MKAGGYVHTGIRFCFLLVAVTCLATAGAVAASEPTVWHSSEGGQPYAVPDTFHVVWLQEPDLAGNSGSSEIIGEYNLETEIADDFILTEATAVTVVRWWGTYWNGFEGPIVSGFNLRFYEETDCKPGDLISEIIIPYNCNETEIAYGTYEYYTEIPPVDFQAGQHAWLSIQAANHDFPPQWGRLEAYHWEECDAMFRSVYFSFPDWVIADDWWGYDASFALYSGDWEGEACCFGGGHCLLTTIETCTANGGTPQGPGSGCDPNPCPQACCFADGRCETLLFDECIDVGGVPMDLGEVCDPNPCWEILEACCFEEGICERLFADVCIAQSGDPQGPGSVCDPNPCARACCLLDGSCQVLGPGDCASLGGAIQELGPCDPNPCPPGQACCFPLGTCRILNADACEDAGGLPMGEGTPCDPNPCAPPETPRACCFPDETCQFLGVEDCIDAGGFPRMPGSVCDPNPCPPPPIPRACCFGNGHCEVLYLEECVGAGGLPQGACTVCEPNPCPQPEACCLPDGTCILLLAEACLEQGYQPQGEGTDCDPNPCAPVRTEKTTWGRVKAMFR